jgi:hypothetical protein
MTIAPPLEAERPMLATVAPSMPLLLLSGGSYPLFRQAPIH